MNPAEHIAAALDFLALANGLMRRRNRLLRSELLWCAAAHAVKAVAKQQGWQSRSHDDLFQAVRLLSRNLDNGDLRDWFKRASRLHRNMYEGDMHDRAIDRDESRVRSLVHRLEVLVN